ncbi:MAG: hypothetical protein HY784_19220 [Chloroflexi bacterium]|nr:hypothetical protein [Chloroflexota bacterium]
MQTLTVSLSEADYRRLQFAAALAGKPLDEVAVLSLRQNLPPLLEVIPPRFRPGLQAMQHLSDEELWEIARSRVKSEDQRRFRRLLRKKGLGELIEHEQQALSGLRETVDRVMFEKAYAFLLLKWRGYRIPTLDELESSV